MGNVTIDVSRVKALVATIRVLGPSVNLDPLQFRLSSNHTLFIWNRTRQATTLSNVVLLKDGREAQLLSAEEFLDNPDHVINHLENTQETSFDATIVLLTQIAKHYKGEFSSHGTEGIVKHLGRAVKEVRALEKRILSQRKIDFENLQDEVEYLREEVDLLRKREKSKRADDSQIFQLFGEMESRSQ